MKDIRITYTYHKKDFDFDEEPTTGTIVLPVEENVAADLLISDLSQPIAGRHIGSFPLCLRDAFVVLLNAPLVHSGR